MRRHVFKPALRYDELYLHEDPYCFRPVRQTVRRVRIFVPAVRSTPVDFSFHSDAHDAAAGETGPVNPRAHARVSRYFRFGCFFFCYFIIIPFFIYKISRPKWHARVFSSDRYADEPSRRRPQIPSGRVPPLECYSSRRRAVRLHIVCSVLPRLFPVGKLYNIMRVSIAIIRMFRVFQIARDGIFKLLLEFLKIRLERGGQWSTVV